MTLAAPTSSPTTALVNRQSLPKADESTGALTYSYPITVPPGRNGLQPDVKLNYNSQATEDGAIFGYGWSVSIPSIERINRKGVDQLYVQNYFTSSLSGELVSTGTTTYAAKIETGDFLAYAFSNNQWLVTDKKGTTYKFGYSAATRQDSPSDSTKIAKWMLEEVRDTNNNYIKFTYFKDAGQIYPASIIYTGNGTTDGIFEVDFSRQNRTDNATSYKLGFAVNSNYRINQIQTKVSGVWAMTYALAYAAGTNGARSMLSTITASGQDSLGHVTTLPATSFTYQSRGTGLTQNTNWSFPINYTDTYGTNFYPEFSDQTRRDSQGVRVVDINGDGLPDLVQSGYVFGNRATHIYLNTGTGWVESTSWTLPNDIDGLPLIFVDNSGYYKDMGVRFADVNGDGLPDILQSRVDFNWTTYVYTVVANIYINNGTNGWTKSATWSFPINYTNTSGQQFPVEFVDDRRLDTQGLQIVDVNGDGLPDLVQAGYVWSNRTAHVYFNKGDNTGWAENTAWTVPNDVDGSVMTFVFPQSNGTYPDMGVRFADVNGDGLPDLVQSRLDLGSNYIPIANVYINNGSSGWAKDTNWVFPSNYLYNGTQPFPPFFVDPNKIGEQGLEVLDINGDGLPDLVQSGYVFGTRATHIYLNNGNGTGWTENTSWTLPNDVDGLPMLFVDDMYRDLGVRWADLNGDGLLDLVRSRDDVNTSDLPVYGAYMNNGPIPDILTRATFPQGGHSDITYKTTPQYVNGTTLLNPSLPIVLNTVSNIVVNDGYNSTSGTAYSYAGGLFYYNNSFDRRFAGFNTITKTDDQGNWSKSYYHQGNGTDAAHGEYNDDAYKIGQVYRVENANYAGGIITKSVNTWDDFDLGSGNKFVKLAQTIGFTLDGDSTHRDTAESYTYDNTDGNRTESIQWGEVTGNDNGTFTDVGADKYTTDTTFVANAGAHILGLPSDETVTNQSAAKVKESRYYYDAQALGGVTKGNLTKREDWKSGTTYVNVQKAYDGTYGLVTTDTDQRGKNTTYAYDANNLYPITVTNALSQATHMLYDYPSGQVTQKTDPNTRVFKRIYDGLGRLLEEDQPDQTTPSTLVAKTTYTYTDTFDANCVKRSNMLDSSGMIDTYSYTDGLGRPLQERKEAEGTNFAVKDYNYNAFGLLRQVSLPYFSAGTARTTATADQTLYTGYAYDAIHRVTLVTTALGNTATVFSDWKQTVTDPRGKIKDLTTDAYGNLANVVEHNGASLYTTTYAYDYLGDLTNITDAAANVRNFTYDGLGRRLTAQDLHAPADATFGTWTFTYDDAGNLTSHLDPKSQTVNYTYDDINRPLTEDYTGQSGTEVTYSYDAGTDGIGRLTGVTNAAINKVLTYNSLGLVASETSTIDGVSYPTSYLYDRQGNQTQITNPDGSQVKYAFDNAGQLETVQRKETTDSGFLNVVTNFDYSPLGQVNKINYANGAVTAKAYDATKAYRLSSIATYIAGSAVAQHVSYAYDNDNNITTLADSSPTDTKRTVTYTYDDLNRLLTATATNVATGQTAYTETYTYDPIGNITAKTGQGSYTYAGNTGSSYANPHAATMIGTTTLTYDNNGNLLTKGTALTNTWDYNNRLRTAQVGSTTSTYAYDPTSGERIAANDGTTTTYYPTKYYDIAGTNRTKHLFANGLLVATITGLGTQAVSYYDHTDHLTGSELITDTADAQNELTDYFPYGAIRLDEKAGTFSEQRKYAGHEYDAATGLSYMDARYYDPTTGRFLSEDPVFEAIGDSRLVKESFRRSQNELLSDPQAMNSYAYARNNPLRYNDPDGRAFLEFSVSFAAFGGSFSIGLQGDRNGLTYSLSYGVSKGGYGAIQLSGSTGDLSHQPETTHTTNVKVAGPDFGLGYTREGTVNINNDPIGINEPDGSVQVYAPIGGGASVSHDITHTRPLYTWNEPPTNSGPFGDTISSPETANAARSCPAPTAPSAPPKRDEKISAPK